MNMLLMKIENFLSDKLGGCFQILYDDCLLRYSNWNFFGAGRNFEIEILPLYFWRNFYFYKVDFANAKRIAIGLGVFTVFWDYNIKEIT